MYYAGKILQAMGLTIILIDYIRAFPNLMSRTILWVGIGLFTCGWLINRFLIKNGKV
ncbi:MAG: hypothetical protein KBD53_00140 [Candidatus Omnitrophica bacterium]|nr:hypothetical protein [Candidatus Omnitrophota bacterium]